MKTNQLTVDIFESVDGNLGACWSSLTDSQVATGSLDLRVFPHLLTVHANVDVRPHKVIYFDGSLFCQHLVQIFGQS